MKKWIFLNSNNWIDALALATVLSKSEDCYNIVRQSFCSSVFEGLKNVSIDFYRNGDNLIKINTIDDASWSKKCIDISKILNVSIEEYEPYTGFINQSQYLLERLEKQGRFSLLYLFPNTNWCLDLALIDSLVRTFEQRQLKFISGGSNIIPCIHGTKDYRGIIEPYMIGLLNSKIDFILTTEGYMTTLGEAFGIKVFVLSYDEGLTLNGYSVYDANQMVNYILSNL